MEVCLILQNMKLYTYSLTNYTRILRYLLQNNVPLHHDIDQLTDTSHPHHAKQWQVSILATKHSRVHLRWMWCCSSCPAHAARPPKMWTCTKPCFQFPVTVGRLMDLMCRMCWLSFCFHILCLFCSERWVTTNTVKHPYLFSSGSKNKVEKVSNICTVFLVW